ncbi:hypothetical protein PGIGA_G00178230 [Pangasianodon gigas]|uniref:Uncharacterized protein n=1 Tax=Pangasianodon gigas TaxID=30993 RepID=A0ACC5XVB2_PANGG|nr:hypothetical protein [Pangasianodon gigas]
METPELDTDNVTPPSEKSKLKRRRSDSPEPSCVSMKSDESMEPPRNFRNRDSSSVHSPEFYRSQKTEGKRTSSQIQVNNREGDQTHQNPAVSP